MHDNRREPQLRCHKLVASANLTKKRSKRGQEFASPMRLMFSRGTNCGFYPVSESLRMTSKAANAFSWAKKLFNCQGKFRTSYSLRLV